MSLAFTRRPARMLRLMDEPVFVQRILDRVISVEPYRSCDMEVRFVTSGFIHSTSLLGAYLIHIGPGESLISRIEHVVSVRGSCRVLLGHWRVFINNDPTRPPLESGVHLWFGPAWRHVPLSRAA